MMSKPETNKIIVFFFIMLSMTLTQYLVSESLEKLSVPLIISLQSDLYLVKSMEIITYIGSSDIKFILLITIFCTCNIYHSFIYTFVCYFSMFLCAWLKLTWQQPRPYWLSDEIIPFECDPGFGYPSNHVLSTVVSFLIFFEIMYEHFHIEKFVNSRIFYWVGLSCTYLICIIIGFGRIVQGVHSIDQVVFALSMGLACSYFFLHLTELKVDNYGYFLNLISNKYRAAKFFVTILSIYIVFLIHVYYTPTVYNPEYVGRVLLKCPTSTPFAKSFIASGQYFMIIGMMIGILYDVRRNYLQKYDTDELPIEYLEDNFCKNDIVQYNENSNTDSAYTEQHNYHSYLKIIAKIFIIYFMSRVFNLICSCLMVLFEINLISRFICLMVLYNISTGIFIFGFGRNFSEMFKLNLKQNVFKN